MNLDGTLIESLYLGSLYLWGWIGGTLYFVVVIYTALHALLNKRNIRAAIGWIGLIWFAPLIGVILYFIFGINRIKRKAKNVLDDSFDLSPPVPAHSVELQKADTHFPEPHDHLCSLAHLTENVTKLPLLSGNSVEPLLNGDETFKTMLETIEEARNSITVCTYIFTGTGIGHKFIEKLINAHNRGVEIRVLIDDVGARYSNPSATQELRNHGISVNRFMQTWYPWKFRYVNLRNHRKIMVVDGKIGFTGGMNIHQKYWSEEPSATDLPEDVHFRMKGPIVSYLQYTFAEDWAYSSEEVLQGARWFPEQDEHGDVMCRSISDGPDDDYDRIRNVLLGALASAEQSIQITSPYFLPDDELLSALKTAALRNLQVDILTPQYNNSRLVQWASIPGLLELAEKGCNIYRVQPPFNHSKLMVVDDYWTFLGSTNWDARSLKLNFEFNVECYDENLATFVSNYIDERIDRSRKQTVEDLRAMSLPQKIRNNAIRLFSPYL